MGLGWYSLTDGSIRLVGTVTGSKFRFGCGHEVPVEHMAFLKVPLGFGDIVSFTISNIMRTPHKHEYACSCGVRTSAPVCHD